ncbi:hypothetical protein D3C74_293800 [compost metagenome]
MIERIGRSGLHCLYDMRGCWSVRITLSKINDIMTSSYFAIYILDKRSEKLLGQSVHNICSFYIKREAFRLWDVCGHRLCSHSGRINRLDLIYHDLS